MLCHLLVAVDAKVYCKARFAPDVLAFYPFAGLDSRLTRWLQLDRLLLAGYAEPAFWIQVQLCRWTCSVEMLDICEDHLSPYSCGHIRNLQR